MIENDYEFSCPYCSVTLHLQLDHTEGARQEFIQDCETCCSPIRIKVEFENGELTAFIAEQTD